MKKIAIAVLVVLSLFLGSAALGIGTTAAQADSEMIYEHPHG